MCQVCVIFKIHQHLFCDGISLKSLEGKFEYYHVHYFIIFKYNDMIIDVHIVIISNKNDFIFDQLQKFLKSVMGIIGFFINS